jgi:hypothetical protein
MSANKCSNFKSLSLVEISRTGLISIVLWLLTLEEVKFHCIQAQCVHNHSMNDSKEISKMVSVNELADVNPSPGYQLSMACF